MTFRPAATDDLPAPGEPPAALRAALASYPRIAGCPSCLLYAVDRYRRCSLWTLAAATLAFHDCTHLADPLSVAIEHFATEDLHRA